jgi:serine phosphatase RsbU (regulator of sigma subunit)
MKQS